MPRQLMAKTKGRDLDRQMKVVVVHRMMSGENVSALAREFGVRRKLLYEWRDAFRRSGPEGLRGRGRPKGSVSAGSASGDELLVARARIAELERKVGQQQLDLDFFRAALRQVETLGPGRGGRGVRGSTRSSKR